MLHGVIGGLDVILNHELLARIPSRPDAGPEERMHAAREVLFAAIFVSLAWFEWHGALVWWIVALFVGELLVSARDVVIEGDTRVLPVPERILHLFLFMNLGVLVVLVGAALLQWSDAPAGMARVDYGWASWVLSVFAVLSLGWGIRDGINVLQRRRLKISVRVADGRSG
jgi:phosphatidylglycerophosphate synthase